MYQHQLKFTSSRYNFNLTLYDALVKIGKSAIEPLVQALETEYNVYVREKVAGALVRIGKSAVVPLTALKDENWHVRERAAEALDKIKKKQ